MSKAFTREDVDPPERSGRVRSASGLPPGAINYMTTRGARHLHEELDRLRTVDGDPGRVSELERALASATIVSPPDAPAREIAFGAEVTLEDAAGTTEFFRIVGVDELGFEPGAVSWISPVGRTLLAARLGERITLPGDKPRAVKITKVEYPADA